MTGGLMQLVAHGYQAVHIFRYWKQIIDLSLEEINKITIYNEDNTIHLWYTNRVNKLIKVLRKKYPRITNYILKCVIVIYIAYTIDIHSIEYNIKYEPYVKYFNVMYKNTQDNTQTIQPPDNSITLNITHMMYLIKIKDTHIMHSINKNYRKFHNIKNDYVHNYFISLGYSYNYNKHLDNKEPYYIYTTPFFIDEHLETSGVCNLSFI